jgi:GrpB-like predicted nucleotidyltransferase (UPF0157 family)
MLRRAYYKDQNMRAHYVAFLTSAMKIIIHEYDPAWVEEFSYHKSIISRALASLAPSIEHIGSTSVAGLGAKPVIDILVGLQKEDDLDKSILPMMMARYSYIKKFEPFMPYRRFFQKLISRDNAAIPSVVDITYITNHQEDFHVEANIHIIQKNTDNWMRHIAFREYLRHHEDIKLEYFQLKKELAKREWADPNEYNNAKNDWIKRVERIAVEWYK